MMKRIGLASALALLVFILSACAGMNPDMAAIEKDTEAKTFVTTPDTSKLYIVRSSRFGGAGMYITPTVDQMVTGILASGSYLLVEVTPGKHEISAAGNLNEPDVVELTTEAGQLYFVEMHPSFGMVIPGLDAELLDQNDGKELVKGYPRYKSCEIINPPKDSPSIDQTATLYVVRPSQFTGALMLLTPTVDDRVPATLEPGSFVMTQVCQGTHVISAAGKYEGVFTHQLEAEAGQVYYVTIRPKMGFALPKVEIEAVNTEEGEKLIDDYKKISEL